MSVESPELEGQTYYDVLGLPVSPSQISLLQIKAAYHRALLNAHPDKIAGASGAKLDLVREAWRVLSDNVLRKAYDVKIKSKSFLILVLTV
jgi:curved DNA-binding protein CbpA